MPWKGFLLAFRSDPANIQKMKKEKDRKACFHIRTAKDLPVFELEVL